MGDVATLTFYEARPTYAASARKRGGNQLNDVTITLSRGEAGTRLQNGRKRTRDERETRFSMTRENIYLPPLPPPPSPAGGCDVCGSSPSPTPPAAVTRLDEGQRLCVIALPLYALSYVSVPPAAQGYEVSMKLLLGDARIFFSFHSSGFGKSHSTLPIPFCKTYNQGSLTHLSFTSFDALIQSTQSKISNASLQR